MRTSKIQRRSRGITRFALIGIMAGAILSIAIAGTRAADRERPVVFKDVAVFDGLKLIPKSTVVIQGTKIAAVGTKIAVPKGAEIIDGQGLTLLPGFIDSHVHAFSQGELQRSLMFGVTTVMDMMTTAVFMKAIKKRQAANGTPDMADLFSAGAAATAPGGHGTEYGGTTPTLTKVEEAAAFVADRKAEGVDYIKIMSGFGDGKHLLGRAVIAAVASEAKKQGLLSVVHLESQSYAREAVEDGVNGLAHCIADVPPEQDFIDLMKAKHAFVIPTLSVMSNLPDAKIADLVHDPRLAPYLSPDLLAALAVERQIMKTKRLSFAVVEESVRRMHQAGIPILVGTDSSNPGTAHGLTIHSEFELLAGAGMKPADILTAATALPAETFGLKDRGRIAPGLRADLLLVRGNPAEDIKAARDIVGVWKIGQRLDRETYRASMEALQKSWKETGKVPAPSGSGSGLISDFDLGDCLTDFGFAWFETTDAMMGGKSTVAIEPAAGGAEGSAGSMAIAGQLNPGFPMPWAGAAFYPGITYWTCPNLSAWNGVSFWAKGQAGKAVVMIVQMGQQMPAFQFFDVGPEWKEFTFSFADLGKTDGTNIQSLVIGASQTPGPFKISVDKVRLVRIPPQGGSSH